MHVCGWMTKLREAAALAQKKGWPVADGASACDGEEFRKAVDFLWLVRCFLHYRHERDDNTLDWQAQDAAAETHGRDDGAQTEEGGCGVLDAALFSSCAERGAAGGADAGGGAGVFVLEAAWIEAGAEGGGRASMGFAWSAGG